MSTADDRIRSPKAYSSSNPLNLNTYKTQESCKAFYGQIDFTIEDEKHGR